LNTTPNKFFFGAVVESGISFWLLDKKGALLFKGYLCVGKGLVVFEVVFLKGVFWWFECVLFINKNTLRK